MASNPTGNPGLGRTILNDFRQGEIFSKFAREARDIRDFYLSEEEREQLRKMGRLKSWLVFTAWILKNMFLKLTPLRRVLLVIGLVLILLGGTVINVSDGGSGIRNDSGQALAGAAVLLIVLMLELKDKLLAHSELEDGRAVQMAMRPEQSPAVPGWNVWLFTHPANEVGGDLVDFQRLAAGRFGLALGDVAGKGLGAALMMVKLQATLRALAPDYESLTEMGSKLNAILIRDGIRERFASLIFMHFGSDSATIRYINAGHMPPLVVSPSGVEDLAKGNPALGLSSDARYLQQEILVGSGRTVVLYSDGVTEARNEAGEFYGADRLRTLCAQLCHLSSSAIGESIVTDVRRFIGNAAGTDDLSLAILQRAS